VKRDFTIRDSAGFFSHFSSSTHFETLIEYQNWINTFLTPQFFSPLEQELLSMDT